ncbi:MAG: hypothetical protein HY835_11125 [Anaerolineae bacterium]|nr:hypothetical protein [Anaerolineae bacterium]
MVRVDPVHPGARIVANGQEGELDASQAKTSRESGEERSFGQGRLFQHVRRAADPAAGSTGVHGSWNKL